LARNYQADLGKEAATRSPKKLCCCAISTERIYHQWQQLRRSC
jgi:hypothetical protein